MERKNNNHKEISVLVLILAALSFVRLAVFFVFRNNLIPQFPNTISETVANISFIVITALGILFLIPQVYLGIKGLRIANGAAVSKAYTGWAKTLFVFAVLAVAFNVYGLIGMPFQISGIITVIDGLADAVIYTYVIKCARDAA